MTDFIKKTSSQKKYSELVENHSNKSFEILIRSTENK